MCPPIVRFLTKIVHPNVSRHGDVGIDIIQHNWSLALTISKLLLSVQSLLTDPFTDVGRENRGVFFLFKFYSSLLFMRRFAWNQNWDECTKLIVLALKHSPVNVHGNMQCMNLWHREKLTLHFLTNLKILR